MTCESCSAPIVWATSPKGKPMPFDAHAVEAAGVYAIENGHAVFLGRGVRRGYMPHHATCPQAGQWRQR